MAYEAGIILLVPRKWEKKKLIIPSRITYVNTQQICGSKIEEIVLHNNVKEVASQDASLWEGGDSPEWGYGENEFQEQRQLKKIFLQKGSKYYKMKDGVLYKKEGNGKYEFEGYPIASRSRKKVRILEGTTRLGSLFTDQRGLKLVLPKSLKKFRDNNSYSQMIVSIKKGNKHLVKYRNGIYNRKKTELYYIYHTSNKSATLYIPPSLKKIKSFHLFDTKKVHVYIKGGKYSAQWKKLKKQCWHTGKMVVHSY